MNDSLNDAAAREKTTKQNTLVVAAPPLEARLLERPPLRR